MFDFLEMKTVSVIWGWISIVATFGLCFMLGLLASVAYWLKSPLWWVVGLIFVAYALLNLDTPPSSIRAFLASETFLIADSLRPLLLLVGLLVGVSIIVSALWKPTGRKVPKEKV